MNQIWLRPSIRWLLVLVAVAVAFFAGQRSSARRAEIAEERQRAAEARQRELEQQVAKLMGFNLYTDEYAAGLKKRIERATKPGGELVGGPMEAAELFSVLNVDKERLPSMPPDPFLMGDEVWLLAPSYYLTVAYDPAENDTFGRNWELVTSVHVYRTERMSVMEHLLHSAP